jgi:hypothetical protein
LIDSQIHPVPSSHLLFDLKITGAGDAERSKYVPYKYVS